MPKTEPGVDVRPYDDFDPVQQALIQLVAKIVVAEIRTELELATNTVAPQIRDNAGGVTVTTAE